MLIARRDLARSANRHVRRRQVMAGAVRDIASCNRDDQATGTEEVLQYSELVCCDGCMDFETHLIPLVDEYTNRFDLSLLYVVLDPHRYEES